MAGPVDIPQHISRRKQDSPRCIEAEHNQPFLKRKTSIAFQILLFLHSQSAIPWTWPSLVLIPGADQK